MEQPYPVIEFEAEIGSGGVIALPGHIASLLGGEKHVTIRLTRGVVARSLRDRNVTEAEVEQIAMRQLEHRDTVIRFLKAEGALAGDRPFRRRASLLLTKRQR